MIGGLLLISIYTIVIGSLIAVTGVDIPSETRMEIHTFIR